MLEVYFGGGVKSGLDEYLSMDATESGVIRVVACYVSADKGMWYNTLEHSARM
jgi:hypothetical protein